MSDPKPYSLALSSFKRPVYYDKQGQFIADADHSRVLDIRGWGRIQYMDRPEERQDAIGEMVAALINQAEE